MRLEPSFEAEPSTPRPTGTPSFSMSGMRAMPEASFMFDDRAVAHAGAGLGQKLQLFVVKMDAVRVPHVRARPSRASA